MYKTILDKKLITFRASYLKNIFALSIIFLLFTSCTYVINVPLYENPTDWQDLSIREKTIGDYSTFIKGKKIFLDPGHGGEDRKNTSRNGKIVEADVNLNVSLFLKEYLTKAGAEVYLARVTDETVPLALRSELANASGADLFISIHHNAPSRLEDDYTNYTSTYYHSREGNYEYEPCERDIARYIQRDLAYVMRNSGGLGSFDGTYSDYNIYPGEGFSVLRKTKIPAVLVECAFHTSRWEELRLNDQVFNQIQAWGIFRGIAKYFRSGIPQIQFWADSTTTLDNKYVLTFALTDSSGINPKSITVYLNKQEINYQYDAVNNLLKVVVENLSTTENTLRIICANKNGNHSLPFHMKVKLNNSQNVVLEKIN